MGLGRGRVDMSEKSMQVSWHAFLPLRSAIARDTARVLQSAFGVPWQRVVRLALNMSWRGSLRRCADAEATASGAYLPRMTMQF